MTNRLTHTPFGLPASPRRIEDDPMFNGWSRDLPRLWYLDQRNATRLDAESIYGASQYAVFYNRAQFTAVAAPVQTGQIATRGYYRSNVTDIGQPVQTPDRTGQFSRTHVTTLAEPVQSVVLIVPSGGPVHPVVHPIPPDRE